MKELLRIEWVKERIISGPDRLVRGDGCMCLIEASSINAQKMSRTKGVGGVKFNRWEGEGVGPRWKHWPKHLSASS